MQVECPRKLRSGVYVQQAFDRRLPDARHVWSIQACTILYSYVEYAELQCPSLICENCDSVSHQSNSNQGDSQFTVQSILLKWTPRRGLTSGALRVLSIVWLWARMGAVTPAQVAVALRAALAWPRPTPARVVHWSFWTSSFDEAAGSRALKRDFGAAAAALGERASLRPRFLIRSGRSLGTPAPTPRSILKAFWPAASQYREK